MSSNWVERSRETGNLTLVQDDKHHSMILFKCLQVTRWCEPSRCSRCPAPTWPSSLPRRRCQEPSPWIPTSKGSSSSSKPTYGPQCRTTSLSRIEGRLLRSGASRATWWCSTRRSPSSERPEAWPGSAWTSAARLRWRRTSGGLRARTTETRTGSWRVSWRSTRPTIPGSRSRPVGSSESPPPIRSRIRRRLWSETSTNTSTCLSSGTPRLRNPHHNNSINISINSNSIIINSSSCHDRQRRTSSRLKENCQTCFLWCIYRTIWQCNSSNNSNSSNKALELTRVDPFSCRIKSVQIWSFARASQNDERLNVARFYFCELVRKKVVYSSNPTPPISKSS